MTPDPNEGPDPMHEWNGGLKIYRNEDSTAIRYACKGVVETIRIKKHLPNFDYFNPTFRRSWKGSFGFIFAA